MCRVDSTTTKLDVLRQLGDIIKGKLTDDNLDQFMSAYSKLRAQVLLSRGDSQGNSSDAMELKARSLLREGADKLEGAFRKVLEQETQVADARQLIRCASTKLYAPEQVFPAEAVSTPKSPESKGEEGQEEEFPGLGTSQKKALQSPELVLLLKATDSAGSGSSSKSVKRTGGRLPLFPEPDDDAAPAGLSPAGPSTENSSFRKNSSGSLPLFPQDGEERNRNLRLQANHADCVVDLCNSRDAAVARPTFRKGDPCDDVVIPGVAWDQGSTREERILASGEVVGRLKRLAKAMVDSGLEDSCLRIYRDVRGLKVIGTLKGLDVGPTSVKEVESLSTAQADKSIKKWKKQIKIVMHSVMPAEWKLCSQVLSSASSLSDQALHSIGEEVFALLFPVADALADGMKSEARLVLLLDLYETLVYLMPFLEEDFPEGACCDLHLKARNLLDKVEEAVKQGLRRFQNFIQDYSLEDVPPNGSYPKRGLVTYVMSIIMVLSGYKETLEAVYERAQWKEVLEAILESLEKSIERQARKYKNDAQAEFFLMNNKRHIVVVIKDLSFKEILTPRWVNRRNKQVQQHALAYQKIAWGPLFAILDPTLASNVAGHPEDELESSSNSSSGSGALRRMFGGARDRPKGKLEEFSQAFARIYWEHRCWLIPDRELRAALLQQISTGLLDRYRPLLEQRARAGTGFLGRSKRQAKTAFTAETVQTLLFELFAGQIYHGDEVPINLLLNAEDNFSLGLGLFNFHGMSGCCGYRTYTKLR